MSKKRKFCSQCGAPLEETDRFCPVCGAKVDDIIAPDQKKSPTKKAPIQSPDETEMKSTDGFLTEKITIHAQKSSKNMNEFRIFQDYHLHKFQMISTYRVYN